MILIKSVEVLNVPGDFAEVEKRAKMDILNLSWNDKDKMDEAVAFHREICVGQRFVNKNGEVVCLGTTKEVADILGLPFSIYERQNRQITSLSQQLEKAVTYGYQTEDRLRRYTSMSFWQRLKFLFNPQ